MEHTNIVLIPVEYMNSRKVCEVIEGQLYKSRTELINQLDNMLTIEDEETDIDEILVYEISNFMDAVNDQQIDNLTGYFISHVKIVA